jgi:superfamily II DNA or RNA helicase
MSDFKQLLKTILENQNIQESSLYSSSKNHENKNLDSSDDIKHAMDFAKHKSHDGLNATFYHKGKKLITYHAHPNGEKLNELLNYDNAIIISGEDKIKMRKAAANHLMKNESSIVFASNIWKAGIDIPPIDVFINAAGGKGIVVIQQKGGRVVRKFEGKEKAIIVDLDDRELSPIGRKQTNRRIQIYTEHMGLKVYYK